MRFMLSVMASMRRTVLSSVPNIQIMPAGETCRILDRRTLLTRRGRFAVHVLRHAAGEEWNQLMIWKSLEIKTGGC